MRSMTHSRFSFLRRISFTFPLLIIVFCLALQTFAIFYPVSPRLWPFLDYPMYKKAHYEGEAVNRYVVFGVFADASESRILPEDLDLDFWKFEYGPVQMLRRGDATALQPYAELYNARQNKKLVALRVEDHPLILSEEGVLTVAPLQLNSVSFEPVRPNGERQ